MSAPIVFFDIAGPDNGELIGFYSALFGWEIAPGGSLATPVSSPAESPATLMGNIRKDPAEKIIYLGVEDITATLKAVVERGGTIDQPRFEVPGTVILGLFRDPAGNRLGLVEIENGRVRIP